MKLFVAGRWNDRERIHLIIQVFEDAGFTITRDWTPYNADSDEELREMGNDDLAGVLACDVFVFIADKDYEFKGSYVELGAAIAWDIPCIIVGNYADRCIYRFHPLVKKVSNVEEAIKWLTKS